MLKERCLVFAAGWVAFWTNSAGNLRKKHRYVNLTLYGQVPWQKDYISTIYSHLHLSTALTALHWFHLYSFNNRNSLSSASKLFTDFFLCLYLCCLCLLPLVLHSLGSLIIFCFSYIVLQFYVFSHLLCNTPGSLFKIFIRSLPCSALPVSWSLWSFCKWNDDPVCPEQTKCLIEETTGWFYVL